MDTITRTHLEWTEEDCYPSEPKFVASPAAVDEDDGKHLEYNANTHDKAKVVEQQVFSSSGVILSSVISVNPEKSPFMLVLDAKSFKEIARASVNVTVHLDLHGIFIPQEPELQ